MGYPPPHSHDIIPEPERSHRGLMGDEPPDTPPHLLPCPRYLGSVWSRSRHATGAPAIQPLFSTALKRGFLQQDLGWFFIPKRFPKVRSGVYSTVFTGCGGDERVGGSLVSGGEVQGSKHAACTQIKATPTPTPSPYYPWMQLG